MRISDWSSDVCSSDLVGSLASARPLGLSGFGSRLVLFPDWPCAGANRLCGYFIGHHSARRCSSVRTRADLVSSAHFLCASRYPVRADFAVDRSEEHTSELQSLMRISYAVFFLNKKKTEHT